MVALSNAVLPQDVKEEFRLFDTKMDEVNRFASVEGGLLQPESPP